MTSITKWTLRCVGIFIISDFSPAFNLTQLLLLQFFAIAASDGIFDVLSPETVAEYLGQILFDNCRQGRMELQSGNCLSLLDACERLIREASRLWMRDSIGLQYRDDISIIVSKINFVGTRT